MKKDYEEFLTNEINQKLDYATNMMIKKYCNIDNIKQEKVITQQEEKEYTEEEIREICVQNILQIAMKNLKQNKQQLDSIVRKTINRLKEIKAKQNGFNIEEFKNKLQKIENVELFEQLSCGVKDFVSVIDVDYFGSQLKK